MAVYFVTGKLGQGKTLGAVWMIKQYLRRGAKVATNLDLNLKMFFGPKTKLPYVRLPDKPSADDLDSIGFGNRTYDEEKNGLLVLDECGTWFNSRTWNDKSRQKLINWLLHARKRGWDIIFIVQNIAIVDKQARLCLCEFLVLMRRLDRIPVPFVSSLFKMITGVDLKFLKIHWGIVKYSDSPRGLTADNWFFMGKDLYDCYDTKQEFSEFYESGPYSVIPPRTFFTPPTITGRWLMRMTRIYLKRVSRFRLLAYGSVAGLAIGTTVAGTEISETTTPTVDYKRYKIHSILRLGEKRSKIKLSGPGGVQLLEKVLPQYKSVTYINSCTIAVENKNGQIISFGC